MRLYCNRICRFASDLGDRWDLDSGLVIVGRTGAVVYLILTVPRSADPKVRLYEFCKAWDAQFC